MMFMILHMNTQPIYEFVIDSLAKAKGRWPKVARGSGISLRTIEKIARKEIKGPSVHHVQTLADYFNSLAT